MNSKNVGAKAFYGIVAPYLKNIPPYTLIDCCAGDGKAGVEFCREPNLEGIIFVDVKEPNKFKKNTTKLQIPFELTCTGIENIDITFPAVIIAVHACGILTDKILEKASLSRSPVAVMPCCYNPNMKKYSLKNPPDKRRLNYLSGNDYYDSFRVQYLIEQGYQSFLRKIDTKITPMNNVIIGLPK